MSTGQLIVQKRDARRSSTVRGTRATAVLAILATLATIATACSTGAPAGPADASLVGNLDGRAVGPSGLEQRLVTKVEAAPAGSPYTALLTATSTIVNTGSAPVRVTARMCLFQESDVETTANMDRFEPFISCSAVSMALNLAPGQSTGPMNVQFGVRSGPGTYTLQLRHALDPEFRASASFRIP
jgi:hypothetical protein